MKIINCQLGMSKVVGRFPRSVVYVVADPIHEVVQFPVPKFGVEDRLNFEFWDVVHMDGQRGGHDAARERVGHVGLQEADVEYIMNLHGRWKIQSKSRGQLSQ